jgi:hypothetical protein
LAKATTSSIEAFDVLTVLCALPLNVAVIEWLPRTSGPTVRVAIPPFRLALPRVVAPSVKVTVPVAASAVILACNVAVCNVDIRLGDTVKVVRLAPDATTVTGATEELLLL